jgi:hypothetical protein
MLLRNLLLFQLSGCKQYNIIYFVRSRIPAINISDSSFLHWPPGIVIILNIPDFGTSLFAGQKSGVGTVTESHYCTVLIPGHTGCVACLTAQAGLQAHLP